MVILLMLIALVLFLGGIISASAWWAIPGLAFLLTALLVHP